MKKRDIEEWYKRVEAQNHYQMIVCLKENNEPIANIGFDRNNIKNNSIQISCWLHPNYWKKGYMKEALVCAMDFIYKQGFDNMSPESRDKMRTGVYKRTPEGTAAFEKFIKAI